MPDLTDIAWTRLHHAYGIASDIPKYLTSIDAAEDPQLTSALCHQGTIYDASYAAMPHLVALISSSERASWVVVALIASIEISRLESLGPPVPTDLRDDYFAALERIPSILAKHIRTADELLLRATLAANAAIAGQPTMADAILELTPSMLQQYAKDGWP